MPIWEGGVLFNSGSADWCCFFELVFRERSNRALQSRSRSRLSPPGGIGEGKNVTLIEDGPRELLRASIRYLPPSPPPPSTREVNHCLVSEGRHRNEYHGGLHGAWSYLTIGTLSPDLFASLTTLHLHRHHHHHNHHHHLIHNSIF